MNQALESAEWRSLLAAIVRSPGDDVPRLVAADWLEENGRERWAEYIRRSMESSREVRPPQAAKRYFRRLLTGIPRYAVEWRRGFPTVISVVSRSLWLQFGPHTCQVAPIQHVEINAAPAGLIAEDGLDRRWCWAPMYDPNASNNIPEAIPDEWLELMHEEDYYYHRDARAALSRAALSWARREAGLPELVPVS